MPEGKRAMEILYSIFTVLTGILLRLALPMAITAVIILWLRWLDAKWQLEALQLPSAQAQPKPAVPCWETRNCSEEERAGCPVFGNRNIFCWQYFRAEEGRLQEKCLTCKVFRQTPVMVPA